MTSPKISFLVEDGNKVYFTNGYKLNIIIPKDYFDEEIAVENGLKISTLGIFKMEYYKNEDTTKPEYYQFSLPETIQFSFSEMIERVIEDEPCKVFTLYENDLFVENNEIAQSSKNTENFVKLHFKGKIPKTIKYSDIINLYMENMQANSCDLGAPSCILEVMIGELARDPKDYETPFRKAANNEKVNEYNFYQSSIKNLAMINSTFTAITSEDINMAIVTSVTKNRTNAKEAETPIEKVMKY